VEHQGPAGAKASQAIADLEKIDADAVKRARTQMAFGFLQRARTIGPASATQSVGVAGVGVAGVGADGLTASAADAASGANLRESPPDPATFAATNSGKTTGPRVGGATVAAVEPTSAASVEKSSANPRSVPAENAGQSDASPAPHTLLVVGLPLVAAVLLVAVFWIILRSNAV
jgi:hypothetical protein